MHPFVAEQLVADHQAHDDALHSRLVPSPTADRPRSALRPFRWPLRLAAVLGVSLALVGSTNAHTESGAHPSRFATRMEPVTLVGLTPLGVERVAYEPGASRAWREGEQIVGVTVLTGSLTVYSPSGERHVYVAGEGYAAGWTAYSTVNETDDPVETLVTRHVRP